MRLESIRGQVFDNCFHFKTVTYTESKEEYWKGSEEQDEMIKWHEEFPWAMT